MINNILIIEDDKNMQELVHDLLTLYGLKEDQILIASDPIEGLDIFREKKEIISLVICDYYMPKSNGAELCEIIKKNQPHTPIVLQTGDLNIHLKDFKSVDSVLHKPYEYDTLIKVIEDLCVEPPEFNLSELEKRTSGSESSVMSVLFQSSKKSANGLVLNISDSGCKIAMKPTVEIKEKAILETRVMQFDFKETSCEVKDKVNYEIVWFELLSLDICLVGLKLVGN